MTKRKNHSPDFKTKVALEARLRSLSKDRRQMCIERNHPKVRVRRQCQMLSPARSNLYYAPKGESAENQRFMETPWYGARQMARHMQRHGHKCGRHRVRRLMRLMRLVPIYQTPNTSKKHPQHKIYPYLLRGLTIDRPNQVWCVDITYIPMRRGFLHLVAFMDWFSRKVLSWRLSNSMEADFCVEAMKEAIAWHGVPEIMNRDQGSQFTGFEWIQALKDADVKISMDGKGRWIDNRMIERHWRSLKYECVYLNAFETGSETRAGIEKWIAYYNAVRPHSTHGVLTPDDAYDRKMEPLRFAA